MLARHFFYHNPVQKNFYEETVLAFERRRKEGGMNGYVAQNMTTLSIMTLSTTFRIMIINSDTTHFTTILSITNFRPA